MAALNKQLETLKTIVPEEKETDEFIRLMQGAAAASGVQIRKLTAQTVVSRDYHYDMPFRIQVDGPYYDIVDFFARLSRLSRIINVGDLKFDGFGEASRRIRCVRTPRSPAPARSRRSLPSQRVRRAAPRAEPHGRPAPSELIGQESSRRCDFEA